MKMQHILQKNCRCLFWLCAVGVTSVSLHASAQARRGVITIREVTIVGRVQKPVASLDVSKIPPKLTLSELRHPLTNKIEKSVEEDPF